MTKYKIRVETCILGNVLCASGHVASKGRVLDLFVSGWTEGDLGLLWWFSSRGVRI